MVSPEVLRRYPYFAGIGEATLKSIAMIAEEESVAAGTQLFAEGDKVAALSVIVRGEIDIQYLLGNGELRTVDTLMDGELLCWSALVEPFKCTAMAKAVKKTELVSIAADKLRELCDNDSLLGYKLGLRVAKLLAHRLESTRLQLASLS
jgi:CRP/FNR family cyclic AMP-dependent transcriptional regulator